MPFLYCVESYPRCSLRLLFDTLEYGKGYILSFMSVKGRGTYVAGKNCDEFSAGHSDGLPVVLDTVAEFKKWGKLPLK
jgi:hypothetical protein